MTKIFDLRFVNTICYPTKRNQEQIKDVFIKIIKDFGGIDLCVFSSGTYVPKLEQEINIKQNKFVICSLL